MARSRISEEQVIDAEFVSPEEHADPQIIPHYLTMCLDFPSTYSGTKGKLLVVGDDEVGLNFVSSIDLQTSNEYPRYYIEPNINISVNSYGQYILEEVGYIEVAGSLALNAGSMVIIK